MYSVSLDRENIRKLLINFHTLTGIRIAFVNHTLREFISEPEEVCSFCRILRQDKKAHQKCIQCDKNAFETARDTNSLYVYECHAGLIEAVSPIIVENRLLGYLMMGQTLRMPPVEKLWEQTRLRCSRYNVDFDGLEKAFFKTGHLSLEKVHAAARIMDMSAKYILLSKLVKFKEPPLIERIRNHIESNMDKPVTISGMGRELNISKSYLSRCIKSEFGTSLTNHVRNLKIKKAKELLEQTDRSINEIALQTGFSDQNYFTRVFKKLTGSSPTEYRDNHM